MPDNILKATISVVAPNIQQTTSQVVAASGKMQQSLQKVAPAGNQATQSLTNLGRVVQDAPFGFLGIANNLNPLLESFQRLRATTGSNALAFKALGSSLLGAGGLGFALSAASTLLILFGDRLFGASKKAKEAEDANKKYKDSIDAIFSSTAREATEAGTLVAVLKNETETRERKLQAIKELQRIQPEIFAGLKLEGQTVLGLDTAYKNYIDNLSTVIAVKIKQVQLEKLITEQLTRQGATLTKSQKGNVDLLKGITDSLDDARKKKFGDDPLAPLLNQMKANVEKKDKEIATDIENLFKDIQELSKGVKIGDFKEGKEEADKFFNQTIAKAKALEAFIRDHTIRIANFEIDPADSKEKTLAAALKFISETETIAARQELKFKPLIRVDFDFIPDEKFFKNIQQQAEILGTRSFKEVKDAFEKEVEKAGKSNPLVIRVNADLEAARKNQAEFFKALGASLEDPDSTLTKLQKNIINTKNLLNDTLVPAFDGLVTAILAGRNPLEGFFNALKSAIDQLIQKLITAALQALILSALSGGSLSFLSQFKGILGLRAQGGPVTAGGSYIVGEKGPELFVPNTGGTIVPNNAVGNFAGIRGSQQLSGNVMFEIAGNRLIGVLANANRSKSTLV